MFSPKRNIKPVQGELHKGRLPQVGCGPSKEKLGVEKAIFVVITFMQVVTLYCR
jgi:hypothetical protein